MSDLFGLWVMLIRGDSTITFTIFEEILFTGKARKQTRSRTMQLFE